MLDEKSPVPLYYQLQEIIRSRIDGGQWQPGQQLPPEAELCREFSLSRGTVRQALADLVREGKLTRRRGKGSFVAKPKISQDLLSASSFADYAQQVLGNELGTRVISVNVVPASKTASETLQIAEGSEVVQVSKVKLTEGQPYFLVTSMVARDLCPGLEDEDHSAGSLFSVIRDRYGFRVTRVEGWFEPVLVSEHEAPLLEVDRGSPAMKYHRIRYTEGDHPLMFSIHIIRGDMCRLTFQINDNNGH